MRKKKTLVQSNEKEIQKSILDWLSWKKIFHYRNNTGAFSQGEGKSKRYVRFGRKGSPDIICVIKGRYVGIECKAPRGKQTEDQIGFQSELELAGGKYILARSIEDVEVLL